MVNAWRFAHSAVAAGGRRWMRRRDNQTPPIPIRRRHRTPDPPCKDEEPGLSMTQGGQEVPPAWLVRAVDALAGAGVEAVERLRGRSSSRSR